MICKACLDANHSACDSRSCRCLTCNQRPPKTREAIIGDARSLLTEIEGVFRMARWWNENVRPADAEPLDPDPDGQLRRLAESISHMLVNDPGHGPLSEILP